MKYEENLAGGPPVITKAPDGTLIEAYDLVRTATRVENTRTGEMLSSYVPKSGQVPFFNLNEQPVQLVQISLPMRMKLVWVNEDKLYLVRTEIMLAVADTDDVVVLKSDTGPKNVEDLNNFAPWELAGAEVRKIKVAQYGGAGLYDSDIQTDRICVGDIAAWFGTPGGLRSQSYLWDKPVFSTGAQFAGRFPESPWGVWFASDALSNDRIHAPIFCAVSMESFLRSYRTTQFDYSDAPEEVEEMFNPKSTPVNVFCNSMTQGRNYKFVDRILKRDKKKMATTDMDKEAKSLVRNTLASDLGESYTIL